MAPNKTRKNGRKSPQNSATNHPEGTIQTGNDKQKWVVKETGKGVKRWVPYYSASLFGYAPLTAKYIAKHINKPINVYEKQSTSRWPKRASDLDVKYSFTASGDAELNGRILTGWLKNKTPAVKKNDIFILKGVMKSKDIDSTLQVAPVPGELVSSNLMNSDAFIKV